MAARRSKKRGSEGMTRVLLSVVRLETYQIGALQRDYSLQINIRGVGPDCRFLKISPTVSISK